MHPTNIQHDYGYLGPHEQILEVGDEHNVVFQQGSDVPFCMTPQQRVSTKFSHYDELSLKDNTKSDLFGNLKSAGMNMSVVKGDMVGELQNISL